MDQIAKQLRQFGKLKLQEPMSKHTTFKIGGPARYFLIIESSQSLLELLKFLEINNLNYFILGGGSNMLVSDNEYEGVVIKYLDKKYSVEGEENNIVNIGAGINTVEVANKTIKDKLTGFEWGVGIPGTIGGAIRGNAGATGSEIKDNLLDVEIFKDGEVLTVTNQECEFGYRDSIFKHTNYIILSARLVLKKVEENNLNEGRLKALEVIKYRGDTQPKGFASTGCIFKNIDIDIEKNNDIREEFIQHADLDDDKVKAFLKNKRIPAGWLVEMTGFKGKQVGQAKVSDVHGNFIVNLGGALSTDVISLIESIKQEVYNKYRIDLEEEIQIISS